MKNFIYLFLAITVIFSSCTKEEGCTDSLATNFNVDAENDDGSCVYGVVGGEWITQSIEITGSMTVTFGGLPFMDSTFNYIETNPDSLDPYKLVFSENNSYVSYDNSNNPVEGGTWSSSGDQLTMNTPDTTLVLTINSLNKDNVSLSLTTAQSTTDDMGVSVDLDITQTINSDRTW